MKREDILNMQAGREMDELIDLYVFDIETPHHIVESGHFEGNWFVNDETGKKIRTKDNDSWPTPKFSTDISAAWEVAENINSIKTDTEEGYKIKAKFLVNIHVLHGETAKEASRIICVNALLAVLGL